MVIKYTLRISFFNIMDNSSVTVEAGFWAVWAFGHCGVFPFHYVLQFEIWLKAGLPQFSCCKFYKHCGLWKERRLLASTFFKNGNA